MYQLQLSSPNRTVINLNEFVYNIPIRSNCYYNLNIHKSINFLFHLSTNICIMLMNGKYYYFIISVVDYEFRV